MLHIEEEKAINKTETRTYSCFVLGKKWTFDLAAMVLTLLTHMYFLRQFDKFRFEPEI